MSEELLLPIASTGKCNTTHIACDCVLVRLMEQDKRIADLEAENEQLKDAMQNPGVKEVCEFAKRCEKGGE